MNHNADGNLVKAAEELLANRDRHATEGNVQSDIERLLSALGVGSIESHYQLGQDQADIYLPNRRTFIECKANRKGQNAADPEKPQKKSGKSESPRQQVERYVLAEMKDELQGFFPPSGVRPNAPWKGIVTDGTHWHVYRYPHEYEARGELVKSKTFLKEAKELVQFLAATLGNEMIGKEWVPEEPAALFSDLKRELDDLHQTLPNKAKASTHTKRQLWLDVMKTSGMVPREKNSQKRLFIAHSFLIVIVRMVSHTLTGAQNADQWKSALRDGFASWVLDFDRGRSWAERAWEQTSRYDWSRRRNDVLRELYHEYVPREDRKVFGEYYTPDWLAAMMVEEVLDKEWIKDATEKALGGNCDGVGLLDPACGSGTFLYHAARRILKSTAMQKLQLSSVGRANVVARLLNGLDIHPVAVEIARVNIQRALPAEPTEGSSAFRAFVGDSLQTATAGPLFDHTSDTMHLTSPGGGSAQVPMSLVKDPSFAEKVRRLVNAAATKEPLPPDLAGGDDSAALEECHGQLANIIKNEGNSVWTWYLVHLAGPYLLAQRKVDRIVGNPPWVKLSDIQVRPRKQAMEELGRRLGLQAGGEQAPHLDIASYFVLRTRELCTADPDRNPASWLVKRSAISSGQWELFRSKHDKTLAQSVDLEELRPFGGGDATRCCLLMEHRPVLMEHLPVDYGSVPRLWARPIGKRRPSMQEVWDSAKSKFALEEAEPPIPTAPSPYATANIKQGATIVPHVLGLIASSSASGRPGWTRVTTVASKKMPWRKVPAQTGLVPAAWVRPVHTSPDMLPYMAIRKPPRAMIPLDTNGQLHVQPGRDCRFWTKLDELYRDHKGKGKGTPDTLIGRFDFQRHLSGQPLHRQRGRRMVVYPSSGDIMRAARTHAGIAVVDATLYWLIVQTEAEAGYLVALLNAECLRRAFAECKESGRDFHLHPWRKVPIPQYDRTDRKHLRLSQLCGVIEKIVKSRINAELAERPHLGQPGLSKAAREAARESSEGQEIERIAAQLLPRQTR